jgi:hypothetical protein
MNNNFINTNTKYFSVICEAQCLGFEHVKVNAAFALTMCLAFPEKRFLFLGEGAHLQLIKAELASNKLNNIDFCEIGLTRREATPMCRLLPDVLLMYKLLKEMYLCEVYNLMLLSINSTLLLALKLLLRFEFLNVNVLVVPHSILATITDRLALRPWYWLLRFKLILKYGNMARIRYLILGHSIQQNLDIELPSIRKYCSVINHPYIIKDRGMLKADGKIVTDSKIVFAYLGVAHKNKGFDKFLSIADSIYSMGDRFKMCNYEIMCIGGIVDDTIRSESLHKISMPFMGKHIPNDEYNKLCSLATYAVFPYSKNAYKLYPSGAVFDAFVHQKPVICMRNSYFEHLFESLGDIGYLCENSEEMASTIKSIINEFPHERYQKQCRNIEMGIKNYDPVYLKNILKSIVNEMGA